MLSISIAIATIAYATFHKMNDLDLQTYRIARLLAAIDRVSEGDKTDFGRKLGYKDGAFVRQMVAGNRPITEKTVAKIESLHGMANWFSVAHKQNEDAPRFGVRNFDRWPFAQIDEQKIRSLNETDLIRLEGAFLHAASVINLDIKKHNP